MEAENYLEKLNNAESLEECYKLSVEQIGLKLSYEDFCKQVTDQMFQSGLLTEEELDMICGGSIFTSIGKFFKKTGKAIGSAVEDAAKTVYKEALKPYVIPVVRAIGAACSYDYYNLTDVVYDFAESVTGKSYEKDRQQALEDFRR